MMVSPVMRPVGGTKGSHAALTTPDLKGLLAPGLFQSRKTLLLCSGHTARGGPMGNQGQTTQGYCPYRTGTLSVSGKKISPETWQQRQIFHQ